MSRRKDRRDHEPIAVGNASPLREELARTVEALDQVVSPAEARDAVIEAILCYWTKRGKPVAEATIKTVVGIAFEAGWMLARSPRYDPRTGEPVKDDKGPGR